MIDKFKIPCVRSKGIQIPNGKVEFITVVISILSLTSSTIITLKTSPAVGQKWCIFGYCKPGV